MLHTLGTLLEPAVMERVTLVVNHVLAAEAVATERLRPHAGRTVVVRLAGWPSLLPPLPQLRWQVTPAGLLEWQGAAAVQTAQSAPTAPDLSLEVDASNPALLLARAAAGEAPSVQVEGDAQLAGDVNWLMQNLRWDAGADLERLFGPVVAQQLVRLGSALAGGLRGALRGLTQLGERLRPGRP
jgi:ubiquinone biosynthesis protein UbiJ